MGAFSFIHAADIHLDSPFAGITARAPGIAGVLQRATFRALDALVDLALSRQADFVVLAGDVFDWADKSLAAQLAFADAVGRLEEPGIAVFVVCGNHDPAAGRSFSVDFPDNLVVFPHEEVETHIVSRRGRQIAAVSGISFQKNAEARNLVALFPKEHPGLFSVGLVHANVGGATGHENYAPCLVSDLDNPAIDYWALGHVHTRRTLRERPLAIYPGNTQGRSFAETGPRGCYFVQVEGDKIQSEFCPLDAVRFLEEELSIAAIGSINALESAVFEKIEKMEELADRRPAVCRVTLAGRGPLYGELKGTDELDALLERARQNFEGREPFVWVERIRNCCLPEIDLEARAKGDDFAAQVLALAKKMQEDPEAMQRMEGKALSPLFDDSRIKRAISPLTDDEKNEILQQARLACLELLEESL
ncbi:MAG: DNA repair exonuclease [Desulfatibacillaceae bacterium]|nr:DNA repair exonuclease [Desulfatibacillaceae bacterium]